MNLNVSYNWLKEYVKLDESPHEFAKKISLCGPSVDRITEIKPAFDKVVVGEILELEKHPNADKLSVCKVNIGHKELLNIVCGAPNIKIGQKVPVVLIGGKVGNFEVVKAKIRGIESDGMICSQKELGIGEDHTGIYILPDYVEIGLPLEKVMPINDFIFEMEVTSNRPDAMSIIGIARETATILKDKFIYQLPKPNLSIHGEEKKLSVNVKEPKLCPRYQAVVMTDVKVDSSPLWMQQRLLSSGLRPINNLVDITNYILLEFGQPMHVFDYDKLRDNEIIVRLAKKGEKILALDGKEYELGSENLVIANSENPSAVGGVMGGELSAASQETKTIVFEVANFDPISVRKTARALNLHSDSSNLYEKGLSPEATAPALLRAIELTMELTGARLASQIIDINNYKAKQKEISFYHENIEKVLGVVLELDEIISILESLGFAVSKEKGLKAVVPWWREKDINGEHDLIEEIARIYGYFNLPSKIMDGDLPVSLSSDNEFKVESNLKDILTGFGLSEIYSYSFISEKMIKACELKIDDHIKIANPLSIDFEYMRISLVPGALKVVADNFGFYQNLKFFELSKIYLPQGKDIADEQLKLTAAFYGQKSDLIISEAKGVLEALAGKLNISELTVERIKKPEKYWSGDTAMIIADGAHIGFLGLVKREVLSSMGIKKPVVILDLDFAALALAANSNPSYHPIPKYPGIDLDLSMIIADDVPFAEIVGTVSRVDKEIIKDVSFLSIYKSEDLDSGKKSLAIRITYRHDEKTLSLPDAQTIHEKVVAALEKEYNIIVR